MSSADASEEIDDYMSDDILNSCLKNDVRPGLLHSHTSLRSHQLQKRKIVTDAKNKEKNPKKSLLEAERREEGLKESLTADNKGFAMLQKMGYKPGTAIGKKNSGIVEPVPLVLKVDRQGLGREAAIKEVEAQRLAIRARHMKRLAEATDTTSYRLRLSQQASEKQTLSDLRRSQRVCEQLDLEQGINEPAFLHFWPERSQAETEGNEEVNEPPQLERPKADIDNANPEEVQEEPEEFDPSEYLQLLTVYLRKTYFYCVWCGTRFNDDEDLVDTCPGPTRDDH